MFALRRAAPALAPARRYASKKASGSAQPSRDPTKAAMSQDHGRTASEQAVKADHSTASPAELQADTARAQNAQAKPFSTSSSSHPQSVDPASLVHGENDASRASKKGRAGESTAQEIEMREQIEGTKAARGV